MFRKIFFDLSINSGKRAIVPLPKTIRGGSNIQISAFFPPDKIKPKYCF
ncbi:MAG: hypothetical protein ACI4TE_00045 [Alphaproteobacteria bacterium]